MNEFDKMVQADLREGEQAYPIYRIDARWTQAITNERDLPFRFTEGLPPGRLRNCTGWDWMDGEVRPIADILDEKRRIWWPGYLADGKVPNAADLVLNVTLHGHDVWCSGWFNHWTFDVGMSDADVR